MKLRLGDAVRFIGFAKGSSTDWPSDIGIIIEVHNDNGAWRYSVAWPNGTIGNWLYGDTLEVISERG